MGILRPQLAGAWPTPAAARAITAMSAGRTRQHPPAIFAPAAIYCRGCPAEYRDRPAQARRRASHSPPLLGYTITGLPVTSRAAAMAAGTSDGAQQLTPAATTSGTTKLTTSLYGDHGGQPGKDSSSPGHSGPRAGR
jgi:hypothetical protein